MIIKYDNNPEEFFSNLSDDEFYLLLEEAGFEVVDGTGEILFTDEEDTTEIKKFKFSEKGSKFKLNEKSNIKVGNKDKVLYSLDVA